MTNMALRGCRKVEAVAAAVPKICSLCSLVVADVDDPVLVAEKM